MTTATISSGVPSFSPRRVLLVLLALLLFVYLADFTWYELRLHFPRLGPASGSVHRLRILAIPRKSNKVEYQIDALRPEEDLPCSHSLFWRGGNRPCWYVTRHASEPIPM
jgi:hypothetical protein